MIPTSAMEIRDRLSKYQFGSGRERTARVARRQDLANLDGPRIRAGSKRERLLSRCAHRERFLTHTANAFPPNALIARTITARSATLPPTRGEAASSKRLFSSARDEKSLIYFLEHALEGLRARVVTTLGCVQVLIILQASCPPR